MLLSALYRRSGDIEAAQNSWNEAWGIKGRFWMPYEYITSPTLSDDFWAIRKVEA